MKTPWFQLVASWTRGTVDGRRPPKRKAEMGTPLGSSHSSAMAGQLEALAVKRAFGCAAFSPESLTQTLPFQSISFSPGSVSIPSHQTSPSSVSATLVKMVSFSMECIAFGLELIEVPGATPKKPASGLMAYSRPSFPNFIQAMSSPIVSTFQPGMVGISIARLVFPHADGKAPVTYLTSPFGFVSFKISMCSANQPSSRA